MGKIKVTKIAKKRPGQQNLNDKQLRFCQEYVKSGCKSASQAALAAGYSTKNPDVVAAGLKANPKVAEKIAEMQAELAAEFRIDAAWVLQRFIDISNRCMEAEPVLDKDGIPTGEYKFDAAGANKATEQIGKHLGFFEKDNTQKVLKIKVGYGGK